MKGILRSDHCLMAFLNHDRPVSESVHIPAPPKSGDDVFRGQGQFGAAALARPPTPLLHVDALLVSINRKLPEPISQARFRREEKN